MANVSKSVTTKITPNMFPCIPLRLNSRFRDATVNWTDVVPEPILNKLLDKLSDEINRLFKVREFLLCFNSEEDVGFEASLLLLRDLDNGTSRNRYNLLLNITRTVQSSGNFLCFNKTSESEYLAAAMVSVVEPEIAAVPTPLWDSLLDEKRPKHPVKLRVERGTIDEKAMNQFVADLVVETNKLGYTPNWPDFQNAVKKHLQSFDIRCRDVVFSSRVFVSGYVTRIGTVMDCVNRVNDSLQMISTSGDVLPSSRKIECPSGEIVGKSLSVKRAISVSPFENYADVRKHITTAINDLLKKHDIKGCCAERDIDNVAATMYVKIGANPNTNMTLVISVSTEDASEKPVIIVRTEGTDISTHRSIPIHLVAK